MRPLWRYGVLSAGVGVLHPSADLVFKVGGSGDEGKWKKANGSWATHHATTASF